MKAFALGTMLVLCGALAACSSSSTDGTGSGGSSGDGGGDEGGSTGDGGATTTSTPTSTGATPVTTSTTTTTTGGGTCGADVSTDPTCNACGTTACCAEVEACYLDETGACFDADGALDESTPGGAALVDCLTANCEAECLGGGTGGICDSGLSLGEGAEETDACLGEACCDEFTACTADGTDVQACIDCFNSEAGGPLCDPALDCADTSGCFTSVCDTGISFGDATIDECVGTACCADYETCVGDGSDAAVEDCLACLNSEAGGPLCDAAIACTTESGCVPAQ